MPSSEPLDALAQRARTALTDDDSRSHVAYDEATVRPGGTKVEYGGVTLTEDDDFLVVFVDEMPGANWAHPARYLVVSNASTSSTHAEWPPSMGPLPTPWRVLSCPNDIEDWQLLPLESSRTT